MIWMSCLFPRITADKDEATSSGTVMYPSGTLAQSRPPAKLCPPTQCTVRGRSQGSLGISFYSFSLCTPSPGAVSASWAFNHLCMLLATNLSLAWTSVLDSRPVHVTVHCTSPLGCPRGSTVHEHHHLTNLPRTPCPLPHDTTSHPSLQVRNQHVALACFLPVNPSHPISQLVDSTPNVTMSL